MKCVDGIFNEFIQKKDSIEISISEMKHNLGEMIHKIVLYGAGSAGIAFLYYLRDIGIEPLYFADAKESRHGEICEGLEIIAPSQIITLTGEHALVIVTINTDGNRYCKSFEEALRIGGHTGVHTCLRKYGCKNVIDYTYFRRCYPMFKKDNYNLPSCSDVYLMVEEKEKIKEVYNMLADEESREVFLKILEFRLLSDSIKIPTLTQEKQYFEYGFYPKRKDEVFVDCGAFNGISLETFLKENTNEFDGYYGFEPDVENYKKLQNYVKELPPAIQCKIKISEYAVYSHNQGVNLYSLNGPGSFVASIGTSKVNTITIDEAFAEKRVSYIKMNIEGSEIQALEGAEWTIRKQKPRLAIAGYHKTRDFWEIPCIMKKYNSDYKIYLRSYMNHISFVYYAV